MLCGGNGPWITFTTINPSCVGKIRDAASSFLFFCNCCLDLLLVCIRVGHLKCTFNLFNSLLKTITTLNNIKKLLGN